MGLIPKNQKVNPFDTVSRPTSPAELGRLLQDLGVFPNTEMYKKTNAFYEALKDGPKSDRSDEEV